MTQPEVISAAVGLDPRNWKLVRVVSSEAEPNTTSCSVVYQIAHVSGRLLDTLPQGAAR